MARMSSAGLNRLQPLLVSQTAAKPTASLIFLHGSGDTGEGIQSWLKLVNGSEFNFPHIRIIYPTAPVRPYTPNGGLPSNVWFDRQQISPQASKNVEHIDEMFTCLDDLIAGEAKHGIPCRRIIVGGFSMGGGLALHYGYRHRTDLAGVFALSSFLNEKSLVFEAHGGKDLLVKPEWGASTHDKLKQCGVSGQYHAFPNLFHEFSHKELEALSKWIWRILPNEL